jgi:hypothetical protein
MRRIIDVEQFLLESDLQQLGRRLRKELRGVNVEKIARKIEKESNARARRVHKILRR